MLGGGTGNDTLRGGVGDDTFVFSTSEDVAIWINIGNLEVALENSLGIADFVDLQTHRLSLVNGVAAISDAGGNTLTFQGIASLAGFDQADFTFRTRVPRVLASGLTVQCEGPVPLAPRVFGPRKKHEIGLP